MLISPEHMKIPGGSDDPPVLACWEESSKSSPEQIDYGYYTDGKLLV